MKNTGVFKDDILSLKKDGFSIREICAMLNKSQSYVTTVLKKYASIANMRDGYFNVDELDCWIFPSKSKSLKYDSR